MSLLGLRVTGNAELDLRPVNGATVLDRGAERLITAEATAAVEASTEEAISFANLFFFSSTSIPTTGSASFLLYLCEHTFFRPFGIYRH